MIIQQTMGGHGGVPFVSLTAFSLGANVKIQTLGCHSDKGTIGSSYRKSCFGAASQAGAGWWLL